MSIIYLKMANLELIVDRKEGESGGEGTKAPTFTFEEMDTFLGMVERMKQMGRREGVQHEELKLDFVTRRVKKRRGIKCGEKRLSNGLIVKKRERDRENETFKERFNELVDVQDGFTYAFHPTMNVNDPNMKEEGWRVVHTNGFYFSMKPEFEDVNIYDSKCAIDYLFKFKLYYYIHMVAFLLGNIVLGFALLFSPIVWMDNTRTDIIFFGNETSSPPLSSGLVAFSTITFLMWCAANAFGYTNACAHVKSIHAAAAVEDVKSSH